MSNSDPFLGPIRKAFQGQRGLADRALAQLDDEQFFAMLGEDGNSPATLVKHLAGNIRSRFTDFLTTDGEKPDRHRDTEFETDQDSREDLEAMWIRSWELLDAELASLSPEDLHRTVTIRAEPHTVVEALLRSLGHFAYHVGQIVQLARYRRGASWQTLSIARGASQEHTRKVRRQFEGSGSGS